MVNNFQGFNIRAKFLRMNTLSGHGKVPSRDVRPLRLLSGFFNFAGRENCFQAGTLTLPNETQP